MEDREPELIAALERDPQCESAKLEYENFLAQVRPDSLDLKLLLLERAIAESYPNRQEFDRLVDEDVDFRTENYGHIWDNRGFIPLRYRNFNLWLISFTRQRRFAVEQALSLTRGLESNIDISSFPGIVARGRVDAVRDTQEKLLDFIRRYKGPTGSEPEVEPHEIVFRIAPSWIKHVVDNLADLRPRCSKCGERADEQFH